SRKTYFFLFYGGVFFFYNRMVFAISKKKPFLIFLLNCPKVYPGGFPLNTHFNKNNLSFFFPFGPNVVV
ncbi:hypothetical protein ACVGWD_13405, partial [Enterobacter asburiae]